MYAIADGKFAFADTSEPAFARIKGTAVIHSTFPNEPPATNLGVLFGSLSS